MSKSGNIVTLTRNVKRDPSEQDSIRNDGDFVEKEISTNRRYTKTYSKKTKPFDYVKPSSAYFESIIEVEEPSAQVCSNAENEEQNRAMKTVNDGRISTTCTAENVETSGGIQFESIVEVEDSLSVPESNSRRSRRRKKQITDGPFQCSICDEVFPTKYSRYRHLTTHKKRPMYACNICKKTFVHRGNLKVHHDWHTTNDNVPCHLCGKKFRSLSYLEIHSNYHFKQKLRCLNCCVVFETEEALHLHRATNDCVKPFECEKCGCTFARLFNLRQHEAACMLRVNEPPMTNDIVTGAMRKSSRGWDFPAPFLSVPDKSSIQVSRTYSRKNNYSVVPPTGSELVQKPNDNIAPVKIDSGVSAS